jgi:UDP-N-acetyl-D-galactosamine dehydrogenase
MMRVHYLPSSLLACYLVQLYPWADADEANIQFGPHLIEDPNQSTHDAVLLAVTHNEYRAMGSRVLRNYGLPGHEFFNLKKMLD